MWEIVSGLLGLLLAVYGAADLITRLAYRWALAGREPHGYLLLPVRGERTDVEYLARRLRALQRMDSEWEPVLLDVGLTHSAAALTREVCARLSVTFVTQKEWEELLKTALQEGEKGV